MTGVQINKMQMQDIDKKKAICHFKMNNKKIVTVRMWLQGSSKGSHRFLGNLCRKQILPQHTLIPLCPLHEAIPSFPA
jgi:hypothetical protein